jgi:hypothetical protein
MNATLNGVPLVDFRGRDYHEFDLSVLEKKLQILC